MMLRNYFDIRRGTVEEKVILKEGDIAPLFSLPNQDGELISLEDNKKTVLYFYPKDSTPGCTVEANGFAGLHSEFLNHNSVIFGISKDSVASHKKFSDKHSLPFDLLSDMDSDMCQKYSVFAQKSMFGKKYMGINRTTFLINEKGIISKIWHKVSVKNHANEVLEALKLC